MDENLKLHRQTNAVRMIEKVLTTLNNKTGLLKDKTPEEAYYVVATAFRTFAFSENDWENLKESKAMFLPGRDGNEGTPYKQAIKKISDGLHKKANPNYSKETAEQEKRDAEIKRKKAAGEDVDEKEDDSYQSRVSSHDAESRNNVKLAGKDISFNIKIEPDVENHARKLLKEGNISEALEFLRDNIFEQLESQLSSQDLLNALRPGDFEIKGFNIDVGSNGILPVAKVKNQSLIDALSNMCLGTMIVNDKFKEKKQEQQIESTHEQEQIGELIERSVIDEELPSDLALETIEDILNPVCTHINKKEKNDPTVANDVLAVSEEENKKPEEDKAKKDVLAKNKNDKEKTKEELEELQRQLEESAMVKSPW